MNNHEIISVFSYGVDDEEINFRPFPQLVPCICTTVIDSWKFHISKDVKFP